MNKILIRCDGSPQIGLGHIVRCMALAEELQETQNCIITFAMRKSKLGINIVNKKYPVIVSNEELFNYENWLSECIEDTNADVLILDVRDTLGKEIVKRLKEKHKLVIVDIDDPEEKRLSADLAFYPPIPQIKEMNWSEFKGELYSGWEYVILRKEFCRKYPKSNNAIPNILITMGGSDPLDMTKFVVRALDSIEAKFTVTIILGSGYQHKERLNQLLKKMKYKYDIYRNPSNIAGIMANSDFAVTSFGVTAYELAAICVPTIYLCLTKDHAVSAFALVRAGIGVSLGVIGKVTGGHLTQSISKLIIDDLKLNRMRQSTKKLIRGTESNKISKIIFKTLTNIRRY